MHSGRLSWISSFHHLSEWNIVYMCSHRCCRYSNLWPCVIIKSRVLDNVEFINIELAACAIQLAYRLCSYGTLSWLWLMKANETADFMNDYMGCFKQWVFCAASDKSLNHLTIFTFLPCVFFSLNHKVGWLNVENNVYSQKSMFNTVVINYSTNFIVLVSKLYNFVTH